ncbi:hypothetical protein J5751_02585 [bacterium]|nr:hypothetical protein [bacterium]
MKILDEMKKMQKKMENEMKIMNEKIIEKLQHQKLDREIISQKIMIMIEILRNKQVEMRVQDRTFLIYEICCKIKHENSEFRDEMKKKLFMKNEKMRRV